MTESLVIAGILFVCAAIVWLRPQSLSTLSETPRKNPEMNWQAIRRIAAGGTALLAAGIAGGSWLLTRAGVEETTLTILRIIFLFVGVIVIVALVEQAKNRKP